MATIAASTLATPIRLPCGAVLANRLAKSAMSEQLADRAGQPDEALVRLYRRWAAGGAGLLVTGNVMIDRTAQNEPKNVVVEGESCLAGLSRWAEAGRAAGAELWMQLMHPGRQAPLSRTRPVAPSPVPMRRGRLLFRTPRPLDGDEIERLADRFARSARLAERAGFSGVQIHAAHGHLISQFLSPLTNRRGDRWGGSPENRRRFLLEVVRRTRAAVGGRFALAVKLNSADFQRGGFSHEESMEVVAALAAEAVDLIEISGGTWESTAMFDGGGGAPRRSTLEREAWFLDYAQAARRVARLPIMVTGGFRTRRVMEAAVGGGGTDVVGLARPMALDPELPRRLLAGASGAPRPRRLAVGWRNLDDFVETAWHQRQLERMGRGRDPDLALGRWFTLARALAGFARLLAATPPGARASRAA